MRRGLMIVENLHRRRSKLHSCEFFQILGPSILWAGGSLYIGIIITAEMSGFHASWHSPQVSIRLTIIVAKYHVRIVPVIPQNVGGAA